MKFTTSKGVLRPTLPAHERLGIEAQNVRRRQIRSTAWLACILVGFFAADVLLAKFGGVPKGVGLGLYILGLCSLLGAAKLLKSLR
jgi:hypothetical protein